MRSLIVRNFFFGVEDSLVSTVGLLSGIAAASVPRATIILTGFILVLVEAFSMAVGSFLSERSTEEYVEKEEAPLKIPLAGSVVMFFSYVISGFIPLSPYIFTETTFAIKLSIILTLLSLFFLGILGGEISRTKTGIIKRGFRMLILGGSAVAIGVAMGRLMR